jgi:hypothetical protein
VVPIDCPGLTEQALHRLAAACEHADVAVSQRGPLPGAFRRSTLPILARRLAQGRLKLRDALSGLRVSVVELPEAVLANVNSEADLIAYMTASVEIVRGSGEPERDLVAVEEPLELRIGGEPIAVTMRTPGNDEELALGFAVAQGLEPVSAALPADLAAKAVGLVVRSFEPERLKRHFYTSSSCGVCGKGAL